MTAAELDAIEAKLAEDVSWQDQADFAPEATQLLAEVRRLRAGLEEINDILPNHDETCRCLGAYDPNRPCNCDSGAANRIIDTLLDGTL